MNKVLIIIPTLNEEKNITILHKKIKKNKIKSDILFIDDNSLDNTRSEILNLKKRYSNIYFIFRSHKMGIGSAHKDGFKWAYKKKYNIAVTMDADGTHDPKYINKFIHLMKTYNIVSTTRFSSNKSLLNDWPLYRIFLTKARHFLVSFLLNFALDASGAFRCFDLKKVRLKDIMEAKDDGYSFFWESLFILYKKKFKIYEQKIVLPYRSIGRSKMQLYDIYYAFVYLLYISIKRFFYFR